MASETSPKDPPTSQSSSSGNGNTQPAAGGEPGGPGESPRPPRRVEWKQLLGVKRDARHPTGTLEDNDDPNADSSQREKWTMGIMNDKQTEEVPGEAVLPFYPYNKQLG